MKKLMAAALAAEMMVLLTACGSTEVSASFATPESVTEAEATIKPTSDFSTSGLTYEYAFPASEDFENVHIDCSADEPIELSLSCSGTFVGDGDGGAIQFAQEVVERATDGKVKIMLYESGVLGTSDAALIRGMQVGSVDMFTGTPSGQVSIIPNLAVLDIGGAFSNIDNCNNVMGNFVELIQEDYHRQGLQIMTCYAPVWRLLTSNRKYTCAADFVGTTIRVQNNPYHKTFWRALGADAVAMNFGEVYMNLQQGTLDAQENPYGSIIATKLYEVQKYLYESDHIPFISTDVISKARYDALSEAQKLAVNEFCYAKQYYVMQHAATDIADERDFCLQNGMEYVAELPPDITGQYAWAAQTVINSMKNNGVDSTFLSNYVAAINQVEGTWFVS